jgi:TolB protein
MNRREFLAWAALNSAFIGASCRHIPAAPRNGAARVGRFFFTSQGKTAVMNSDGTGLRYLDFTVPNQVTWQPGPFLSDGCVIFLSMEARRDGPGRPFEEY